MELATIKPSDLAIVKNDKLIPVGEASSRAAALPRGATMLDLVARYDGVKTALECLATEERPRW